jgi:hypothetical protein
MKFIVAVAICVAGCARVVVPDTPEAQQCVRQCMMIYNQCIGSGQGELGCAMQRRNCWLTCPGAYEEK